MQSLCLNVWRRVLAELIPGEDELVFGEVPQVLVRHHPVLDQAGHKLLQHLAETVTKTDI